MRSVSSIYAEAKSADRTRALQAIAATIAALGLAVWSGAAIASTEAWHVEAARAVRVPAGVRVVSVSGDLDPARTIDGLERAGYHVDVALTPGTYFVRQGPRASLLPAGALDVTGVPVAPDADAEAGKGESPIGGYGDVVLPPRPREGAERRGFPALAGTLTGLPHGARWEDTSELMVGRVAVPILFPESDGDLDPSEFDWTPALKDSVIRSAVRGCLQWTALAAAKGVPLTFVLEVHADLPTRYEPIRRPTGQTGLWMAESMETLLGYEGDADVMATELANGARARLGAQWAALCFAVQNDTTATPGFPDGTTERAKLGGPWFIVAVRHANPGTSTLDFYIEHEMAHMFWALDEYPASNAWWACTLTSGYFDQPNSNSSLPAPGYCGLSVPCVMKGNYPDNLCAPTAHQIGWADVDLNGVLDIYETHPDVRPDSSHYNRVAGLPVTIRGAAADVAWPNRNAFRFGAGDSISIATIDSISYRIDGGSWSPLPPSDGFFDSGEERFVLVLAPPTIGNHLLEFQARNSNGKTLGIPASTTVTISGAPSALSGSSESGASSPRLEAGPIPSADAVRFTLRTGPAGTALARLYDVAGREVRSWRFALSAGARWDWEWDGRVRHGAPAPGGVYFLVVEIGGRRLDRRIVLLR